MNARILVDKSATQAMSGQTNLTTYFPHQPDSRQTGGAPYPWAIYPDSSNFHSNYTIQMDTAGSWLTLPSHLL